MFCSKCGTETENGLGFCSECGAEIAVNTETQPQSTEPAQPKPIESQPLKTSPQQPIQQQPIYQPRTNIVPKRKRHIGLYVLLSVLILLTGLIVYMLGSLFFFSPKDLGVRYTPADYESVVKKIGIQKDKAPTTGEIGEYKYVYSGSKKLDAIFTEEELTAWLNEGRPSYFALKKVQIKVNKDDTVEASGEVNFDVVKYIITKSIPNVDWKQIPIPIPSKANVYVKTSGSVTDNTPDIQGGSVNIGAIPIPEMVLSKNNISIIGSTIKTVIENSLPGVMIEKLEVVDGKIHFVGQIPESMTRMAIKITPKETSSAVSAGKTPADK